MDQQKLQDDILDILAPLNRDETVTVDENTVIGDIVSEDEEYGTSNSANYVKMGIEYTILTADKVKKLLKTFPENWLTLTVNGLSKALVSILFLICMAFAMPAKSQVQLSLGTAKTELGKGAIDFSISYFKSLDSLFGNRENITAGAHSIFAFTPVFNIQSGTGDALNSINVKLTGMLLSFKTKTGRSGDKIPDFAKEFNSYPFSLGVESDNQVSFINGIAEAGYVPVFLGSNNPSILRYTRVGIFLQAGYKFKVSGNADTAKGGSQDQSQEDLNSALFRAKGSISIDTKKLAKIGLLTFGLVGGADAWYDFVNGAVYHDLKGTFRVYLSVDKYFDMNFQHGSGAPLFNQGNQYGVGLTVTF